MKQIMREEGDEHRYTEIGEIRRTVSDERGSLESLGGSTLKSEIDWLDLRATPGDLLINAE